MEPGKISLTALPTWPSFPTSLHVTLMSRWWWSTYSASSVLSWTIMRLFLSSIFVHRFAPFHFIVHGAAPRSIFWKIVPIKMFSCLTFPISFHLLWILVNGVYFLSLFPCYRMDAVDGLVCSIQSILPLFPPVGVLVIFNAWAEIPLLIGDIWGLLWSYMKFPSPWNTCSPLLNGISPWDLYYAHIVYLS